MKFPVTLYSRETRSFQEGNIRRGGMNVFRKSQRKENENDKWLFFWLLHVVDQEGSIHSEYCNNQYVRKQMCSSHKVEMSIGLCNAMKMSLCTTFGINVIISKPVCIFHSFWILVSRTTQQQADRRTALIYYCLMVHVHIISYWHV